MEDIETKIIIFILLFWLIFVWTSNDIELKKTTEQIKILEQSLNEQIQEKEVYMKMLEEYNGK